MWGMIWGMNGVAQSQEVSRVWRAVTDCKGQVNGVEAGRGAPLKLLIVELSAVLDLWNAAAGRLSTLVHFGRLRR